VGSGDITQELKRGVEAGHLFKMELAAEEYGVILVEGREHRSSQVR
jgi:hypothetical protein